MASNLSPSPVGRDVAHLSRAHFDSDLARTIYNDLGRPRQAQNFMQLALERRLLAWAQKCSMAAVMCWGSKLDASVVPRLGPHAFRSFCATLVERHVQALEVMPNCRAYVVALARAVHVSRHINPAVLDRLLVALRREGLATP